MTTTRRKYRFKTREEAETAEYKSRHECDHMRAAMSAMYAGEIRWTTPEGSKTGCYGTPANNYRFGLVPRHYCPLIVIAYHCDGQRDWLAVYDEEQLANDIRIYDGHAADDDQRHYRQGLHDARRMLNDFWAEVMAAEKNTLGQLTPTL